MAMKEEQIGSIISMDSLECLKEIDFASMPILNGDDIDTFMASNISNELQNEDTTNDVEKFQSITDKFKYEETELVDFGGLYIPLPLPKGPPERTNFEGNLNFTISISGIHSHKNKFVYSHKLNRIYVVMGYSFSLQFKWLNDSTEKYIRATPVFSDEAQWQRRVERCVQHKHIRTSDDENLVEHVLRSDRAPGTSGVYYTGDPQTSDSWLSVLVEFPPADAHHHAFKFFCKNSCSSGINRRPIEIMFTLEDRQGHVLGRQCVGIRVCSCPGRDINKDESDVLKKGGLKRKMREPTAPLSRTKRLVVAGDDDTVYTLPAGLQIVGSATLDTVINVIENMSGLMAKADPSTKDKCVNSLAQWKSFAQDVKTYKPAESQ